MDMKVKAELNYARIAPRKVRLVGNLIRGMGVRSAERELAHRSARAASLLLKLLKSAVANATQNGALTEDALFVKELRVNPGPMLKRSRPRAFGRVFPIRKRTSHILIVLSTHEEREPTLGARSEERGEDIREVRREEVKEAYAGRPKTDARIGVRPLKAKPIEFVRRVFRRKAI